MRQMRRQFQTQWLVWSFIVVLSAVFAAGCASQESKSVKKEVMTDSTGNTIAVQKDVTETSTTHRNDSGILGGVFHVVGEILAFPFQVIADAFRFIF